MKILVAGATGTIGRPLVTVLLARGHSVVALTRSRENAEALADRGADPVVVDIFDPDEVHAAVGRTRPDAVIEQLSALPATYTNESMRAAAAFNTRIRLVGGGILLAAAEAAGVSRYVRQSIAFRAVPGAGLADEGTPLALDASPAVAADASVVLELERRLRDARSLAAIALRYGFFYGPGTWFNPDGDMAGQVRRRQFPIVGDGDGVWSWVHIEDAAMAAASAAEQGAPGEYLIADDHPLPVREWLPAFARFVDAPPPPRITVEESLRTSGADAVFYGTRMRGVSNAKAKRALDFRPRTLDWIADDAAFQDEGPARLRRVRIE